MTQRDMQRNKLLRLGIFELRNMARDLGVRSPTTLTKEVMIEEMLQIIRGEADPYIPQSKRGRPPKSNSGEKMYETESVGVSMLRESRLNFDSIDSGNDIEAAGFVDNRGEQAYVRAGGGNFYNPKTNFHILNEQILRHKLSLGDKISGMAKSSKLADAPVVVKVEEINGKPPAEHNQNIFDEMQIKQSETVLKLSKLETKVGLRAIGFYKKIDEEFIKFVREVGEKEGFKKIFVGIDCFSEEIVLLNSLKDVECFYTTAEQQPAEHLGLIEFVVGRAKSLACENQNVIIVFNGIDRLVRNNNLAMGRHIYDISSIEAGKKVLAIARQLETGSITVLALCSQKENSEFLAAIKDALETMVSNIINVN